MGHQNDSTLSINDNVIEAEQLAGMTDWVAKNLDGKVTDVKRLERWRPQWKVSYTVGDDTKVVFFRGIRPGAGADNLKFEMQVMQALEANGILVPHIYGWADSPGAFVMDWIETEDRAPGMAHTAMENPSTMDDERWQAMLHYMEELVRVHAVPVSEFTHIKEFSKPPETAEDIALRATDRMYKNGAMAGNIDSTLEFLQYWLHRNVPEHRTQTSFITGDAGQFMSSGTEVLAILDLEIAEIGDTYWDLACFRGRHPYENMGDIPALYRHYEKVSGTPLDRRAIGFHTVSFLHFAAIAARFFMMPDVRGANWIEGVYEYISCARRAYEAIAELQGMTLDYDLQLPEPVTKPWEEIGFKKMMVDIEQLPTDSTFEPWERELLHAIPHFMLNYARYRDWFEQETVADINKVTGQTFDNLAAADEAVMKIIAENDASQDEAWVRIMHRRTLRFSMLTVGTNPNDNPLFYQLDLILE